ncbi:Phosphoserine phosphatase 1 [bioreactor metagenome]|uniref:Phosphoserine phosphatase 1 n=1 Tax=bioreactor metagenome TaxID=1076179 RepID=A0A645GAK0_9ZZZZ
MSEGKRILLIRHGELPKEYRDRLIGRTDPPLSEEGRVACRKLRGRIAKLAPEKFYCSPLRRAVETLEAAGGNVSQAVFDPRLCEMDFGKWENLLFDEIMHHSDSSPEQMRIWAEEPEKFQFPGGESYGVFAQRIDAFLRNLYEDPAPVVAVVTHGGILMRMISVWNNVPPCRQWEHLPPRGSLTVYDWKGGVARHVE